LATPRTKPSRHQATASRDVEWVPSICNFCSTLCNVKAGVKEVAGKRRVVKIEGNPESPLNRGKTCARGQSGIFQIYDPDRIKTPLIREPGSKRGEWKFRPASWDEALDFIVQRLTEEKVQPWEMAMFGGWTSCVFYMPLSVPYVMANGIPNIIGSPMEHCVASGHLGSDMVTGNFNIHDEVLADFDNAKYILFSMANSGVAGISTSRAVRLAEGKRRGARIVVLDPRKSELAAKADEWIPIKPGTDSAFFLAVIHVLLKEGLYEADFLRRHTNAPFLAFKKDGLVIPLMEMDEKGQPKAFFVYDEISGSVRQVAGFSNRNAEDLSGQKIVPALSAPTGLEVNGLKVKTILDFFQEYAQTYTPEWAAQQTGIPAATILRVAREIGTIRPALIDPGWHGARYSNVINTRRLQTIVQVLVGGIDRPGGWLMAGEYRHKAKAFWEAKAKGENVPPMALPGLQFVLLLAGLFGNPQAWPHGKPSFNWAYSRQRQKEGQPAVILPAMADYGLKEAIEGKLEFNGEPYRIRALTISAANPVRHYFPDSRWKELLANPELKLVVVVDVLPSDTAAYADVILPNNAYLERFEPFVYPTGPAPDLALTTRFRAIEPLYDTRDMSEIFFGLTKRRGTKDRFVKAIADFAGVSAERLAEEVKRADAGEISYHQALKNVFFEHTARGLNMTAEELEKQLREKGVLVLERYEEMLEHAGMPWHIPVPTPSGRLELYSLVFLNFVNTYGYQPHWDPMILYIPPEGTEPQGPDEFHFAYGKIPTISYASNTNNRLLMALSKAKEKPFMRLWINDAAARRLKLQDGDQVEVENTKSGQKVKARVFITDMVRPDTVFISSSFGTENPLLRVGAGVGTALNKLVNYDVEPIVSGFKTQEFAVRLRKVNS